MPDLPLADLSLADLFSLADDIGSKYQTPEEIEEVTNQQLAIADELQESGYLDE